LLSEWEGFPGELQASQTLRNTVRVESGSATDLAEPSFAYLQASCSAKVTIRGAWEALGASAKLPERLRSYSVVKTLEKREYPTGDWPTCRHGVAMATFPPQRHRTGTAGQRFLKEEQAAPFTHSPDPANFCIPISGDLFDKPYAGTGGDGG
jgi:hypothetical protein